MRSPCWPASVAWLSFVLTIVPGYSQDFELSDVKQICEQSQQDSDAPWRTIPWETDLIEAQHKAVELHKPLFVWAMDGHPLGCT